MSEERLKFDLNTEESGNSKTYQSTDVKMSLVNYEVEFNRLVQELYGQNGRQQISIAKEYLQELFPVLLQNEELQSRKADLLACCLYMALLESRDTENDCNEEDDEEFQKHPNITITELLETTEVHVTEFFKIMKIIKESYSLSEMVQNHLMHLEKKYCIMSALFYTFERICQRVFREENGVEQDNNQENLMPPTPDTEGVEFRKKLTWTLFLHAKKNFMSDDEELVKSVHLLLCCMEYVLRSTPSFLLNAPYDSIRIGCTPEHQINGMLGKLAEHFDSCIDEVQMLQSTCTESYFLHLPYVDDLDKLTEKYEKEYRKTGDLNDLLFLNNSNLLPPLQQPSRENGESVKDSSSVTMTPVRAALNTVQQLKNILTQGTDEPSNKLYQYFNNCSQNPEQDILLRLKELKEIFIDKFCCATNMNQGEIAVQRYQLAVHLYYRVIEAMLNSEHERLSETDFSRLLNNDSFHRSLLSCSVEVVLVTYGVSWNPSTGSMGCEDSVFSFPWILSVFNLQPYDFFKVLESFIKAEPKLTGDIVRHLQNVENRILESVAWKKGSMLFDAIKRSDLAHVEITSPSTAHLPVNNISSAADLYLSPMKSKSSIISPSPVKGIPSPSALSSATDKPSDKPRRSQSLNLFFNKVCRLGFNRLQSLCDMLKVPKDLTRRVWTCFEHCITQRPNLIENRHIDQIMMCSIYAMCKVVDKEIRFKTIVQKYRNLPHANQQVFKNAFIDGEEYDSIIGFYNKVFMESMKQFILQFSNNKPTTPSLSPVPKSVASPIAGSQKYSVPGRRNFYVSPLKESPFKTPSSPSQMTPRSRQLYCFGDERVGSAENLRSINERVSGYHNQKQSERNTPRTRLRFDQPVLDEGAPPSKAPRIIKTSLLLTNDNPTDKSKQTTDSSTPKEHGSF